VPPGTRFYNFKPLALTFFPQTPHLLNYKRWHHLETYREQLKCQNVHIWNSRGQLGDDGRANFNGSVVPHSAAMPCVVHSVISFSSNSGASC